ncbi:MAG: hypothetical protein PHX51_02750 [Clostridia bacterium]|nr:hypothetical protein [Clostridia bacterium]
MGDTKDLVCPICGEPTRVYMGNARKDRLCGKHADDLKNGKLAISKEGKYVLVDIETNTQKPIEQNYRERQKDGNCIVCGNEAPYGSLCKECYDQMWNFKQDFDKNDELFELKDHYFNLKDNINRMSNIDYVRSNCNKLMALAVVVEDIYGNSSLTQRIVNDIKSIVERKKPKQELKTTEGTEASMVKDARKEELLRTADGHYVKSNPESVIDDILYEARIVHCYERRVLTSTAERAMMADWFIPITDSRHGIYIEYWGMNTSDYLSNKERKRKLYKDHDIPLIEIEKEDYKDRQRLSDRLICEINELAQKYFRITDFIR